MKDLRLRFGATLILLTVLGCSGYSLLRRAEVAEQIGDWDQAVLHYLDLVQQDPGNIAHRAGLLRAKVQASQQHFDKGRRFHEAGSLQRALIEYRQAVELDPTNQYALVELQKVREELVARQREQQPAGTVDEMKERARARSQPPMLNPRSDAPISLEFPEAQSVQDIYRALGKAYGINILFDPNLKDQEIAIELIDVTSQDALEILMRSAGHFYKVLDEHTILIAADTPQNRRAYEDLVIQTFFLSNAEVKDVMVMLRTLVDAKKVAANEQLNAIILRDTADTVKVAERIINANDKARAEVVVDVELLQINTQKMLDLGMSLSNYSISQTLDTGGEGVPLRVSDLEFINQSSWTVTVPSIIYDFMKSDTEAQVLAKPQLRISEGEKAALHIGDRVPIPSTSFNTGNTIGGNIVPITSFQYTDIGIKIDVEPRVHHNLEVTLKVRVEISNLSGTVEGAGGQEQPIIGTRTIETTIRLQDGETNVLAGLIRTDETSSEVGIPGLSDIPVLGRLFSKTGRQNQRTDVILTLTPHIIRKSDITEEDLLPIWVGTESRITFSGGSPRVESEEAGPFDTESRSERIQEAIRNRMRQLPRGLRQRGGEEPEEEEEEEQEAPQGIDLVPSAPPTSIFDRDREDREEEPEEEDESPQLRSGLAPGPLEAPSAVPVARGVALEPVIRRASLGASGVVLELVPGEPVVSVGEPVEVTAEVSAGAPVSHLPFVLVFDPQALRLESWRRGGFLGPADRAEVLVHRRRPGELWVGASRLGTGPGARGEGAVLSLRFRALREGSTRVEARRPRALGPDLERLSPLEVRPAVIQVVAAGAGPEIPLRRDPTRARDPLGI